MKYILLGFAFLCAACHGSTQPKPPSDQPKPPPAGACIKSGCSGTVCVEPGKEVVTTCEYRPEYACYQKATCERQADGACGWTQTAELTACLANPPPG
jgi:eight-cysteine-cluster-containing protein